MLPAVVVGIAIASIRLPTGRPCLGFHKFKDLSLGFRRDFDRFLFQHELICMVHDESGLGQETLNFAVDFVFSS